MRGATDVPPGVRRPLRISIHAPREGSDILISTVPGDTNISIHAPREGSDGQAPKGGGILHLISIHAPREGSDTAILAIDKARQTISIHAPREGSDGLAARNSNNGTTFLSTLPVRGATLS